MLTIKRSCANKIITRAITLEGRQMIAVLSPQADDCEICIDKDQLGKKLDTDVELIIVYNQHADAIALIDGLNTTESQIFIEIRQDTKGVLGLQAIRKQDGRSETLELIYQ
jgi:hypothetical protein